MTIYIKMFGSNNNNNENNNKKMGVQNLLICRLTRIGLPKTLLEVLGSLVGG